MKPLLCVSLLWIMPALPAMATGLVVWGYVFRRSTAVFDRMGWWCRGHLLEIVRMNGGWTHGSIGAARRWSGKIAAAGFFGENWEIVQ